MVKDLALNNLGNVYERLSQYEKARDYYEQALAIRREIKDRTGEGSDAQQSWRCLRNSGPVREGERLLEQALAIRREIKNRSGEGDTLNNLGSRLPEAEPVREGARLL